MERIETARLTLDTLSPEHGEALYRVYSEPAVAQFLITRPSSRMEFNEVFQRMLDCGRSLGMWAVVYRDQGSLIGRCGFFGFSDQARPEFAILLSKVYWNRGLATEAGRACLKYGFQTRGWPEVVALVRPENAAAIRVLLKLGMETESRIEIGSEPALVYRIERASFEDTTERPATDKANLLVCLRRQALGCAKLGSPFYAALLNRITADVEAGGPTWNILAPHSARAFEDAVALRFLGAVHRLVLEGQAPSLACHYPSVGGDGDPEPAWIALRGLLATHAAALARYLERPPQTNEVGRAAALVGGFLTVSSEWNLPLRLLEAPRLARLASIRRPLGRAYAPREVRREICEVPGGHEPLDAEE